eukprot:jgi/Mesvir1/27822/Mv07500-RA.1
MLVGLLGRCSARVSAFAPAFRVSYRAQHVPYHPPVRTLAAMTAGSQPGNAGAQPVKVYNPAGKKRVIVTKDLPGDSWVKILADADCRVEVCTKPDGVLDVATIKDLIGSKCDGCIGMLTEKWGEELLSTLHAAGGKIYCQYAVGTDNIDLNAATKLNVAIGNTPGVLTETTAELAVSLTFAAARRVVEGDAYMRAGKFEGWAPELFVGKLLQGKTLGLVGPGRIGTAYTRMMVEGHKMNLVYLGRRPSEALEQFFLDYNEFLVKRKEKPLTCRQAETLDELLAVCDVVCLFCPLSPSTRHLINADKLALMKKDAILVNASRGPVVDEAALVKHLQTHKDFQAALDVFEFEPKMVPGLELLPNAVIVPHIASASLWTRSNMARIAAANVAAVLRGDPVWRDTAHIAPFLADLEDSSAGDSKAGGDQAKEAAAIPRAAPSIVNAAALGLALSE